MRTSSRALVCLLLASPVLSVPLSVQQSVPALAPTTPPRDPQAVTILNQVIAAGGGADAIAAVSDYTATGTVTCSPGFAHEDI